MTKLALCSKCYHEMIFTNPTFEKKVTLHQLCEKCGKHFVEHIIEIEGEKK